MGLRSDTGALQSFESVEATGTNVAVPDASLLFTGDYSRVGTDLILTGSDGAKFVVTGYFNTDTPPSLVSPKGAMLTGDVVTSLAGPQFPGQYAQAGGGTDQGAESIGKVQTLQGGATVVRTNGVTETLKVGDPVFQGDVVMTGPGAKLGISFLDGTLFSLSNNARMVLNKLVYEPNGSDNSMLFNLVEGTFVFAAGKIAPTGDMKVQTPVATMGIRGTTPTVDIDATKGTVNMSIVPDVGTGIVGKYTLYNIETGEAIGTISSIGTIWRIESATGDILEVDKTEEDLLKDAEAISQINSVYSSWSNNQQQDPEGPQAGPNNSGSGGFNSNPDPGTIDGEPSSGEGGENQQQNNDNNDQSNSQSGPPPIDSDEDDGVNEPPTILGDLEVTVDEGGTVSISTDDVTGDDPDTEPGDLVYTVIDPPDFGQLEFTNNPGVAITTFTQADLDAGRVIYVHDGSEVTSDSYTLLLSDGQGTSQIVTVNVTIEPQVDVITGTPNVDILNGTDSDDIINALESGDFIFANAGNDIVNAGDGDDTIDAGEGDDEVNAGEGNDTIIAGSGEGDDDYDGEGGTDTIIYSSTTQGIVISLVDGTVDSSEVGFDTIANIERFVAGDGNDTLIFAEDTGFFFDGGDGVDTLQLAGGVDIDTETAKLEVENVEIVDIKTDTESNVLTLTADDIAEANDSGVLQIRGGSEDVVNLTNEFFGDFGFPPIAIETAQFSEAISIGDFFPQGSWVKSDQTFTDEDGTVFDIYEFFLFGLDVSEPAPVATAQIEQGVEVNIPAPGALLEGFENGFGPNEWETINAVISTSNSNEGQSSARISTNSLPNGGAQSAAAIALLTGVSEEDLDALADDNAGPGNVTDGGAIVTHFSGVAGQVVSFDWFFSTQDYPNFNDIAFVTLNGEAYKLFDVIASGNQAGNTTTEGWNQFSIVLEDSGEFQIGFGVLDDADQVVPTDLFIDNLELEPIVPGLPVILGGEGNDILIGSDADEIFVGGGGNNTLTGNGGEDTFVIAELNGIDTITDFEADDTLDLTGLLDGAFDPDNDDINDFVKATTDADGNTTVAVDVDGADGPAQFTDVAILQGVTAGVAVAVNIGDDSDTVTSNAAVSV